MIQFYKKTSAFTLAEVLITLGIIGVVAAMTVPALIQNTQDNELKKSWKEIYSQIAQATNQLIADNGGTLGDVCSADSSTDSNYLSDNADCITTLYSSILKNTGTYLTANVWTDNTISYKYLNGDPWGTIGYPNIHMINGAILYILRLNGLNNSYMFVDVNGKKGPNIVGKDMFILWIYPNTLHPAGWSGDWHFTKTCDPTNAAEHGQGCSQKYLFDN